jgi:hypothetical protein
MTEPAPRKRRSKAQFPWATMQVGETFFVPNKPSNRLGGAIKAEGQRWGRSFTARGVDGGAQVTRIK